jgi:hypothetical protein
MNRKIETGTLVGGIILIVLGALFLLEELRLTDFGDVIRRYWPMIIVLVGVPKLFSYRTMWSGLWLIAVGGWLQIARLKLFGLTYGTSWPLLLIALGAGIIIRAFVEAVRRSRENHGQA